MPEPVASVIIEPTPAPLQALQAVPPFRQTLLHRPVDAARVVRGRSRGRPHLSLRPRSPRVLTEQVRRSAPSQAECLRAPLPRCLRRGRRAPAFDVESSTSFTPPSSKKFLWIGAIAAGAVVHLSWAPESWALSGEFGKTSAAPMVATANATAERRRRPPRDPSSSPPETPVETATAAPPAARSVRSHAPRDRGDARKAITHLRLQHCPWHPPRPPHKRQRVPLSPAPICRAAHTLRQRLHRRRPRHRRPSSLRLPPRQDPSPPRPARRARARASFATSRSDGALHEHGLRRGFASVPAMRSRPLAFALLACVHPRCVR